VRRPLGTADLHDVFAALLQERRQAGAEAARAFHCPTAPARHLAAGEAEQLLVAGRIGAGDGLGEHATDRGECRGSQGVAVGVDADDAIGALCQHGHAVVSPGEGRPWSASAWEESLAA
jgi:enhancing lycopene biosynthesis protein 2